MLQHASIDTFVKHYSVGIHVDAQAIVRRLPAQKQLMQFAASMSRVVNKVPRMRELQQRDEKKRAFEIAEWAFQQNFSDYLQQKKVKKELQRFTHFRHSTV
ncbi:hypothetical protein IFM46972_11334 [Aspergillus udagawae]|uniref:Uncharacterized protein n=1 Tax=Aspergillus udagawae TaxID=91492 RepID=A0A8H3XRJ2_9EURO|nr:hypothetical protein IFM46972_11334 [Aspergillus udagawae]